MCSACLAAHECSSVLLRGVVPHHKVALGPPARVVVDVGVVKGLQVVLELEEQVTVSVLQPGALVAPRVPEQDVASAAKELEVVDHDVGVMRPDYGVWLFSARFSCYNLVRSLVSHEGLPEVVWLEIIRVAWEMTVVEMRSAVQKPDAIEVLANVHVPVVADVLGDRLFQ